MYYENKFESAKSNIKKIGQLNKLIKNEKLTIKFQLSIDCWY